MNSQRQTQTGENTKPAETIVTDKGHNFISLEDIFSILLVFNEEKNKK